MTPDAPSAFIQWYCEGPESTYMRARRSPGGIMNMLDASRPAGDMSRPGMPDLVLYQNQGGGGRIRGDAGWGRFDLPLSKFSLFLSAPDFANTIYIDTRHQVRSLAFPVEQWQSLLDESAGGRFSVEQLHLAKGDLHSPAIQFALRNLWALCDEEGAPSRLLARAAGCEILAELCRLGGTPFSPVRGGLAPWAERRCIELMRSRLAEDISLEELAAEARLSPFHFARMFKRSVGVPPRVYLTNLRIEKACDLLETTDRPVTEIAQDVGYSSNQVLARVFVKHRRMTPTDYRRATRDPWAEDIAD